MLTPMAHALFVMLVVALLYEPLRGALSPALGEAVGGVGGVGGLTSVGGFSRTAQALWADCAATTTAILNIYWSWHFPYVMVRHFPDLVCRSIC